MPQLTGEIQGSIQRYFTTGQGNVLVDRDRSVHRQVVIPHESVGSVRLLITAVLLAVTRDRTGKVNFRQLVRHMRTVFPIRSFQFVEGNSGIYRLGLCQVYCLFQR